MAKGILSWQNRIDISGVSFTSDSEASGHLASNVADARLSKTWRTSGATSAYVEIDLGAQYSLGAFGLFNIAIAATDTVRLRASNTAPTTGDLIDTTALNSGIIEGYNQWTYTETDQAIRYLRFDIAATSLATQGWFEVGRIWAGPTFTPGTNFGFDWSHGWQDNSEIVIAPYSGTEYVNELVRRRQWSFALNVLTKSESYQLLELQRIAGLANQILFIADPADSVYMPYDAILGRLTSVSPIRYPIYPIYSTVFEILESK